MHKSLVSFQFIWARCDKHTMLTLQAISLLMPLENVSFIGLFIASYELTIITLEELSHFMDFTFVPVDIALNLR